KEQLVHNHWDDITGQLRLSFAEIESGEVYEYAALVTSLEAELLTLGQLYRATMDGLQSEVSPSLTPRPGLYVSGHRGCQLEPRRTLFIGRPHLKGLLPRTTPGGQEV